jgi:hypothetical protein
MQVGSIESPAPGKISTPAPVLTVAESPPAAPAVPSPPQFSTDMRVDDQHQIYYEFVDPSTGEIVFEIPPEALRAIGESLNLTMIGQNPHSVDVES